MMRELKQRLPGCCLVVTTITNSGLDMARAKIREADVIVYAPYDLPGATRRAMAALRPDLLVLEYTEIWPNLIRAARKAGVRIALTNGRFAPEKLSRYRTFFRAVGNPLRAIDALPHALRRGGRARPAARRPARPGLGHRATPSSTRWCWTVRVGTTRSCERRWALDPTRPVFIAGSTHDGEEEVLVEVYRKLLADVPGLQLVMAPRYVERAGKIVSIAQGAGLTVRLRSAGAAAGPAQVVVLDTIGELAAAYRLATLVFVGGSFITRGGQNVLEPAGAGEAGPLRPAHGELQGQRAGAGGARRDPGGHARPAPQGDPRAPLPSGRDPAARGHGAARRWARCAEPAPGTWTTCCGPSAAPGVPRERGAPARPSGAALVGDGPGPSRPAGRGPVAARRGALPRRGRGEGSALRRGGPSVRSRRRPGGLGGQPGGGGCRQDSGCAGDRRAPDRAGRRARRALARLRRHPDRRPRGGGRGARAPRRGRGWGRARAPGPAPAGSPRPLRTATGRAWRSRPSPWAQTCSSSTTASSTGASARDLDVVVLDAANPWGNGHCLPFGPNREPRSALRRAGLVWLTHVDRASPAGLEALRDLSARETGQAPVESRHAPGTSPTGGWSASSRSRSWPAGACGLLTGVARPGGVRRTVEALGASVVASFGSPTTSGSRRAW